MLYHVNKAQIVSHSTLTLDATHDQCNILLTEPCRRR
jgi:hypothetical protein